MYAAQNTELYGVREVPKIEISCYKKDGTKTIFYCDTVKTFYFNNCNGKITCVIKSAVASNDFWTSAIYNNLNNEYTHYLVSAVTFKRSASTGNDEKFFLLDSFKFDYMSLDFILDGEHSADPTITLTTEGNN